MLHQLEAGVDACGMRFSALPLPILQSVMGSVAKNSSRALTVTLAEPLGAKGKSEPKVTFWPPVNAIKPGSVYLLPAQQRRGEQQWIDSTGALS